MRQFYSVLKKNTLFHDIADDEIESVLTCLGAYAKSFSKGQTIRDADTEVTEIGVMVKGFAYITKYDVHGNRVILGEIFFSNSFGESLAFGGATNSPITVVAGQNCTVIFLPIKNVLDKNSLSNPLHIKVVKNLISLLARKCMLLQAKNDILSQKTTREKLLLYFEYEAKSAQSNVFKIHYTREELADFLCINTSAMSRELGKMRDEGILTFNKNKFVLK